MLRSTPTGVIVRDAGLHSAVSLLNTRQRSYELQLIAASKTEPARDILPVTQRDGEEQAQSGEQPEGHDTWTRMSGARREGLRQRLVRGVAARIEIDASSVTEHTECVEPAEFPETILTFARDRNEVGKKAWRHTDDRAKLSFWTDGLHLHMGTTEASVALRQTQWRT